MGYLDPWEDVEGLGVELNALMREEWALVNAIGELLDAGEHEDVPALVDMLAHNGRQIDNMRVRGEL